MNSLKMSVMNLRGLVMTLVAVLAIGAAAPRASAIDLPGSIVNAYNIAVDAAHAEAITEVNQVVMNMTNEVTVGIALGKSLSELQSIANKYQKRYAKAVKQLRKAITKAEKKALKDLKQYGSPSEHVSYIVATTDLYLSSLDEVLATLDVAFDQWLLSQIP